MTNEVKKKKDKAYQKDLYNKSVNFLIPKETFKILDYNEATKNVQENFNL